MLRNPVGRRWRLVAPLGRAYGGVYLPSSLSPLDRAACKGPPIVTSLLNPRRPPSCVQFSGPFALHCAVRALFRFLTDAFASSHAGAMHGASNLRASVSCGPHDTPAPVWEATIWTAEHQAPLETIKEQLRREGLVLERVPLAGPYHYRTITVPLPYCARQNAEVDRAAPSPSEPVAPAPTVAPCTGRGLVNQPRCMLSRNRGLTHTCNFPSICFGAGTLRMTERLSILARPMPGAVPRRQTLTLPPCHVISHSKTGSRIS